MRRFYFLPGVVLCRAVLHAAGHDAKFCAMTLCLTDLQLKYGADPEALRSYAEHCPQRLPKYSYFFTE